MLPVPQVYTPDYAYEILRVDVSKKFQDDVRVVKADLVNGEPAASAGDGFPQPHARRTAAQRGQRATGNVPRLCSCSRQEVEDQGEWVRGH